MLGRPGLRRLRRRVVAAAGRDRRLRLAARPRAARPGLRGRAHRRGAAAAVQVVGHRRSAGASLSVEDVPLVDELRYALGDVPARHEDHHELDDHKGGDLQELTTASDREYAPTGRSWTPPSHRIEDDGFAHVLVDEAQDLTPMQWRMVGRRGRAATWTIVGDPAQSSWPVPEESAAARAAAIDGKQLHEFHLSTNYRNSSEIYAHAAAYAERVGLDADLPTAVRSTGVEPTVVTDVPDLEQATREAVAAVAGRGRRHRRHRGAGRPPLGGQRVAGVVAGAGRGGAGCPGRRRLRRRAVGRRPGRRADRARHQGPGVRRHRRGAAAGDRGRVGHRPGDPLRRAHPGDPAVDDGGLTIGPAAAAGRPSPATPASTSTTPIAPTTPSGSCSTTAAASVAVTGSTRVAVTAVLAGVTRSAE